MPTFRQLWTGSGHLPLQSLRRGLAAHESQEHILGPTRYQPISTRLSGSPPSRPLSESTAATQRPETIPPSTPTALPVDNATPSNTTTTPTSTTSTTTPPASPRTRMPPQTNPTGSTTPFLRTTTVTSTEAGRSEEHATAIAEFEGILRQRRKAIIYRRLAIVAVATGIYAIVLGYTLATQDQKPSYLWGFAILLAIFYQLVYLSLRRELKLLNHELTMFKDSLDQPRTSVTVYANRFNTLTSGLHQPHPDDVLPPPPPCYAEAQLQPPAYTPKPIEASSPPTFLNNLGVNHHHYSGDTSPPNTTPTTSPATVSSEATSYSYSSSPPLAVGLRSLPSLPLNSSASPTPPISHGHETAPSGSGDDDDHHLLSPPSPTHPYPGYSLDDQPPQYRTL
ncbi:hypothetical protein H4R33_000780 [Dimargaris cristalligena]|uniref:Uncharacterized protein n=1 Tax=Dimargaris cristalligena TaxID=215637 RepID=A0A4P9ZZ47_9FUNG|nr:hypothetical protein H4R33_000780 [Dimargaris cristalligena]RKP38983.1 hypothetical protein BJ085DRAFT_28295 [Dimargaris cristalligena]|eukprot:RKP38983.1 hypothetical protein BJ085DRAFT_28295 [Dimargaris cristalligena]